MKLLFLSSGGDLFYCQENIGGWSFERPPESDWRSFSAQQAGADARFHRRSLRVRVKLKSLYTPSNCLQCDERRWLEQK